VFCCRLDVDRIANLAYDLSDVGTRKARDHIQLGGEWYKKVGRVLLSRGWDAARYGTAGAGRRPASECDDFYTSGLCVVNVYKNGVSRDEADAISLLRARSALL
jgi:hypothetical protein